VPRHANESSDVVRHGRATGDGPVDNDGGASSANSPATAPRLQASGLSKRYGAQVALRAVDFDLAVGEIVAVVGENGAGKSTFSKILAGAIRPDSGDLRLDGRSLDLHSPREALRAGISYIPQELAYLPNLNVADSLLIGRWPSRFGFTTRPGVRREAARVADEFSVRLDVRRPISDLRLAERQLAEILKALARHSRLIVLDEPTASLTAEESANLFRVLRGLARSGVGVIFISHRLDEIFEIGDRIVVLRNGSAVANVRTSDTTPSQLIEHMLGAAVARAEREGKSEADERVALMPPALRVSGLSRSGLPNISNLSFELREGEVLGLFGPRGSGADVVADGLGGRVGDFRGQLECGGVVSQPFKSPGESKRAGIGYVPAERKRDGLVLGMSVEANLSLLTLKRVSSFGFVNRRLERRRAAEWRERLQIRCNSMSQSVESLSGGNQQKVMLASRLEVHPRILVLNEPARGVDVGARAEIHRYLRAQAKERGTAVLWVTSDAEEAVLVCDRILVMRDGTIVGELHGNAKTQANALALATADVGREAGVA
jgi:ribose transport system ATP-binding protein